MPGTIDGAQMGLRCDLGGGLAVDKRIIQVPSIYPMTWQYSPAIEVRGGRTLYLSGIIGARPDGTIPEGDIVAQAALAFANLEQVLLASGATTGDVVKVTVYVGEDYVTHAAAIREIRARYFTADYPASTLVRVAGFANPAYLFEIEAIAVIPEPVHAVEATDGSSLRIVRPPERSVDPREQTAGMRREGGVTPETSGSRALWAGHVTTPPGMVSGAHHHGDAESAIFVLSGRARFRWGTALEQHADVGPGDFIHVPPRLVHAEENLSETEAFVFVVARNAGAMTTVNVDVERRDPAGG